MKNMLAAASPNLVRARRRSATWDERGRGQIGPEPRAASGAAAASEVGSCLRLAAASASAVRP